MDFLDSAVIVYTITCVPSTFSLLVIVNLDLVNYKDDINL